MKAKEITKDEFLKMLSKWEHGYIKKPKSWQKIWLWWERNKNDPKEQWFMNIAKSTRTGIEESAWITAKQFNERMEFMEGQGYKYYANT